jgi:hypothetical protein
MKAAVSFSASSQDSKVYIFRSMLGCTHQTPHIDRRVYHRGGGCRHFRRRRNIEPSARIYFMEQTSFLCMASFLSSHPNVEFLLGIYFCSCGSEARCSRTMDLSELLRRLRLLPSTQLSHSAHTLCPTAVKRASHQNISQDP